MMKISQAQVCLWSCWARCDANGCGFRSFLRFRPPSSFLRSLLRMRTMSQVWHQTNISAVPKWRYLSNSSSSRSRRWIWDGFDQSQIWCPISLFPSSHYNYNRLSPRDFQKGSIHFSKDWSITLPVIISLCRLIKRLFSQISSCHHPFVFTYTHVTLLWMWW